ncbi:MAG: hypothetical protein AAFR74_01675 [Pseudomonadota bacterium]
MSSKKRNVQKCFVSVSAYALIASFGVATAQVAPADETAEQTAERLAREQGFIRPASTPEQLEQAAFDNMVKQLKLMDAICTRNDKDPDRAPDLEDEIDELAQLYLSSGVERFEDNPRDISTGALITRTQECLRGRLATQGWMDGQGEFSARDPEIDEKIKKALADRSDAKLKATALELAGGPDPDTPEEKVEDATSQPPEKGGVVQDGYLFPVGDEDDGIEEDTEIDDDYEDAWVPRIRGWVGAGRGKISDRGAITAGTEIFGPEDEAAIISAVVDEVSLVFATVEVAAPKMSGPDFLAGLFKDVRFTGGFTVMEGDENGARDIDSGGTTDIGLVYSDIVDTSSSSTSTGVFFGNSFDINTRAEADVERLNLSIGLKGTAVGIYDEALSVALKAMYSKEEVRSSSFAEVDVASVFGAGTANSIQINDIQSDRESYGIGIDATYDVPVGEFSLGGFDGAAGLRFGAMGGVEYYESDGTASQLTTGDAGVVGAGEANVSIVNILDDSGFSLVGGAFGEVGLQLSPEDANLDITLTFGASFEDLGGGHGNYRQAFSPLGQPSGWDTARVDLTTTYVRIGVEF